MEVSSLNSKSIFISYSYKDIRHLHRLHVHLADLERQGIIVAWSDTKITPGANWREEIEQAMESAKIAVLLISADFLASAFIAENVLPPLLTSAATKGKIILPVILSPSTFEYMEISQFQPVNHPSQPLTKMSYYQREELWAKVAKIIREAVTSPQLTQDRTQQLGEAISSTCKQTQITPNSQLKQERQKLHLTQRDVAEQIGVPSSIVERWENGTTTPSSYILKKLSGLFGKSAEELGFSPSDVDRKSFNNGEYDSGGEWGIKECP